MLVPIPRTYKQRASDKVLRDVYIFYQLRASGIWIPEILEAVIDQFHNINEHDGWRNDRSPASSACLSHIARVIYSSGIQ